MLSLHLVLLPLLLVEAIPNLLGRLSAAHLHLGQFRHGSSQGLLAARLVHRSQRGGQSGGQGVGAAGARVGARLDRLERVGQVQIQEAGLAARHNLLELGVQRVDPRPRGHRVCIEDVLDSHWHNAHKRVVAQRARAPLGIVQRLEWQRLDDGLARDGRQRRGVGYRLAVHGGVVLDRQPVCPLHLAERLLVHAPERGLGPARKRHGALELADAEAQPGDL
mmetsp:Transcript_2847/g.9638  ORF Transcript_2847/g.9638 Transcript_2847/m.9638 type:complete len:221 (-) Transcript_2847:769-1431(-)